MARSVKLRDVGIGFPEKGPDMSISKRVSLVRLTKTRPIIHTCALVASMNVWLCGVEKPVFAIHGTFAWHNFLSGPRTNPLVSGGQARYN